MTTTQRMKVLKPFNKSGDKFMKPEVEASIPEVVAPTPPAVNMLRPVERGTDREISGFVKIFRFYGVGLEEFTATNGSKQLRGDCPFPDCRKEHHFFAKPGTGQWDCKRCQRAGNVYDFIRHIHRMYLDQTDEGDYAALAELRPGISVKTLQHWQLAWNSHTQEWMIPTFNSAGEVVNIHVWRNHFDNEKQESVQLLLATPSLKLSVYGLQQFNKNERKKPIWICEGHWDAMAFHTLLTNMNLIDDHRFLALPGAGNFPKEQLQMLSGCDVRFLLDNDLAGKNGTDRIIQAMGSYSILPSKLSSISWPESLPSGFDVRDLVKTYSDKGLKGTDPFSGYKNPMSFIQKNLKTEKLDSIQTDNEGFDPEIEPIYCPTFETLVESCRQKLYFTQGLEDTLAILLAVNLAVSLGGNPLWTYVVGPPSSGKTTLADIMAASHPYCVSKSRVTGLFSGWKGQKGDPGMLPKFQGKTLIIKDFTTILGLPPAVQEQLFSQLRDVYDGDSEVSYLNGQNFSYKGIRFSIVACVTDEIRAWNRTALGERFLTVEIDSHWDENGTLNRYESGTDEHMIKAIQNTLKAIANPNGKDAGKIDLKEPKSLCWGLLEYLHSQVETDPDYKNRIIDNVSNDEPFMLYVSDLAKWCSLARTNVSRDRSQDLTYRPRPELGLRLASQLIKMAAALCMVFQIDKPDQRVVDIVRKVALDTSISFPLEIMLHLAHHPDARGMSKEELCKAANITGSSMQRILANLMEINVVCQGRTETMYPKAGKVRFTTGRPTNLYTLTPDVAQLAIQLGFSADPNREME